MNSRVHSLATALGLVMGWSSSLLFAGQSTVTLSEAEMIKVQWDTRDLTALDLDGDARIDVAVINNDDARIDLYYQLAPGEKASQTERKTAVDRWEPMLDDARFERVKVLTGSIAYDMAFGDLNADGRSDLVYTNDRDEIVIHWQGEKSDWSTKEIHEFENLSGQAGGLWIGDLLGDGKPDLLCSTDRDYVIFPDGKLDARPVRYSCVYEEPGGLRVMDMNGDGRLDLVYFYLSGGKESYMTVRFQSEDGRFVGERFFGYESSSTIPIPLNWKSPGDARQSFVAVSEANHTLVQLKAGLIGSVSGEDAAKGKGDLRRMAYAVPVGEGKASFYAVADFTGDAKMDVVASDGAGAQVWLFQQTADGQLRAPESFPAFANITGLAAGDLDGDGRAELVMISEEEGVLGVARFSEEKRFSYPEVVPLSGAPERMTVGDLNGDSKAEIVCSVKGESNRTRSLVRVRRDAVGNEWAVTPLSEDEIASRVETFRVVDLDQDGDQDVVALSSVQALEVLVQEAGGVFKKGAASVAGLADKLPPSAISQGDLDGDGKEELLITRGTFARSARLGEGGRSEVLDQINAPDLSASLLVSLAVDTDGDQQPELLLVDGEADKIHVMARDEKGVYRLSRSHPGVTELSDAVVTDADGNGKPDVFLFGKSHFWWYPMTKDDFQVDVSQIYETDLKDVVYSSLLVGSMDGDAPDDLIAFDNTNSYMMELLLTGDAGPNEPLVRSALHFKLFEVDPHFQGQRGGRFQPYDGVLADLNADGKQDVALLLHDRLVIYPQQ